MCRGSGRCIDETTCCPFYDMDGNCTDSCSTNNIITPNYECCKCYTFSCSLFHDIIISYLADQSESPSESPSCKGMCRSSN